MRESVTNRISGFWKFEVFLHHLILGRDEGIGLQSPLAVATDALPDAG
jgi:hypothetical protein